MADFVDYESLTVAELKDILRKGGLPLSGKKSELILRISKNQDHLNLIASYEKVTVAELKDILRKGGLPLSGKKSELIQRVSEHRSNQSRETIVLSVVWSGILIGVIFATLLLSFVITIFDRSLTCYGQTLSDCDYEPTFGAHPIEAFFLVLISLSFFLLPTRVKLFGPW